MQSNSALPVVPLLLWLFATSAFAESPQLEQQSLPQDELERRAQFNYQLYCQGCHGPDGSGKRGVPSLKDSIGTFLKSQHGREYLIRVPGTANAPLDDLQLTELMNWTIIRYAGASLPELWQSYVTEEVSLYRQQPLLEVQRYRQQLLAQLLESDD